MLQGYTVPLSLRGIVNLTTKPPGTMPGWWSARSSGLSERRPGPARRLAAKDLCPVTGRPGSATTAPGSCSPGPRVAITPAPATRQRPMSVNKASSRS